MKKNILDQEKQLLNDCIEYNDKCNDLVSHYWHMVYNIVKRVFIRKRAPLIKEDLNDVRQDVFVRLFQNDKKLLHDYKPDTGTAPAQWIMIIANNTALNYLNKERKRRIWEMPGKQAKDIPDPDRNILEKISLKELKKELPPTECLIVKLHIYGYGSKEIGEIINKTEGAVNTILYRIRKKLQEKTKRK